jgi:hypothetical protein
MMVVSYLWGQKEYRIPYAWKKLVAYITIVAILFFVHKSITIFVTNVYLHLAIGAALLSVYTFFILRVEKKEFQRLPVIGKYIK